MKTNLPNLEIQVANEIHRLHQFFVDWFNGELPKTEKSFADFRSATADTFTIIGPSGSMMEIDQLAAMLFEAHDKRPGLQIEVKNVKVQQNIGDYVLATYEEWQLEHGAESWTSRISTSLLCQNEAAPSGLMWHHVHETWFSEE